MTHFTFIDWTVFVLYTLTIVVIALWVSRTKKGTSKTANDYFLASRSLPWWVIGSSLIAANISAEHFIAMSGSGYAIGLAIAAYEWVAAITLIIVAKYFLPVFLERKIFTMPQFLKQRYDARVSTSLAVFWLLLYVFVNLTSVSYLGALALEKILGIPLMYGIIGLVVFSGVYSIYGGLKAVAWTDMFQVVVLVFGGIVTTYLALDALGQGGGAVSGFMHAVEHAPNKFKMIIEEGLMMIPDGSGGTKDAFMDLPGLGVILGSMWLTNLSFWGFNQYIIQRGLAGKSLKEAQYGVIFAGYLKLLVPLIVVIPGIAAFSLGAELSKSDEAYPWLLTNIVPPGITGLAFAAIAAAVVSSLSSLINSTSTIFTMDIYKAFIKKDANDRQLVLVGRLVAFFALLISALVAPQLQTFDQAYQYVQEYTGFVYPGVFLIFFLGLFWKKASANAALWTALLTLPLGAVFKFGFPEVPFIMRIGYVFIILSFVMVLISLSDKKHAVANPDFRGQINKKEKRLGLWMIGVSIFVGIVAAFFVKPLQSLALDSIYVLVTGFILLGIVLMLNANYKTMDNKALIFERKLFKTPIPFNIAAMGIIGILAVLYTIFW
ncbi:MAG: sodium/sugar symporter [Bacteroidales bacterium]|nr:sodium/sugar symporter [Bacteroidales bacterium]